MRFINKNAYIQIALTGKSFLPSAQKAFEVIATNFARVGALQIVSTVFLLFGRVFVAAASALIGFVIFTNVPT